MKISPNACILFVLLLVFCALGSARESFGAFSAETVEKAEARKEKLMAGALKQFRPTAKEAARLNVAPAVNIFGQTKGYFTNPDGVSGYFMAYSRPFNFIWQGPTKSFTALDGQTYQIMDGQGKLALKYMDDDLILQKYEGGMADGLYHGQGRLWQRNENGRANSIFYEGAFQRGQVAGRGLLTDYDSSMRDMSPMEFRGSFKYGVLHGHGSSMDLVEGRVLRNGTRWFLGESAAAVLTPERWLKLDQESELNDLMRQYSDIVIVGPTEVGGRVNERPGEGPLAIILPKGVEKADIRAANGRSFKAGPIRRPQGQGKAFGLLENFSPEDYPLPLTIHFERDGRQEGVSLTVKRPFILELL